MPSAYAHYRFGKELLPQLPGEVRQCIQRFRRMYDMGLSGPDFFFYYSPFLKTPVGDLGNVYHRKTGLEFFPGACQAASSEAAQAYLYGLLAHYCLDSACHPYVQQIAQIGEATHVGLESEFDRYLLVLDKVPQPHTYDPGKYWKLTRGECMTAAGFYPPATGGQVSRSIRTMALWRKFLAHPNRNLTDGLLQRFAPKFRNHFIPVQETDALAPYVRELDHLYNLALERYPRLLEQLLAHLREQTPLGGEFTPPFG